MKKIFNSVLISVLVTSVSFAETDYQARIKELENGFADLQRQIKQLKRDMGSNTSESHAQRLSNLEAYAVQLNEVLADIQEKVDENSSEVIRVSQTQESQPRLGVYGTVTAGKSSNENSILDGQSFELILSGQPHERISYFTELEFERSATVGGSRGGEVLVEQAYTDIKINSWMNFRGGIVLVPFGNIERDHFSPLREVVSQPYTSYALAPSDWTDNGFGINGNINLSDQWIADYQFNVIAGLGSGISPQGLRRTRQGFGVDNNNNKAMAAKISLQNSSGLTMGFSFYNGKWDDAGTKQINGFNFDFDYQWKWLDIVGEFTRMNVEREFAQSAIMDGYYIRGIYSLENLLPNDWLSQDFPHAKLSIVTQYDQVNIENVFDINQVDNWEKRYTIGLRFEPTNSWIANLNYETASAGGPDTILRGNSNLWIFSLGYVF